MEPPLHPMITLILKRKKISIIQSIVIGRACYTAPHAADSEAAGTVLENKKGKSAGTHHKKWQASRAIAWQWLDKRRWLAGRCHRQRSSSTSEEPSTWHCPAPYRTGMQLWRPRRRTNHQSSRKLNGTSTHARASMQLQPGRSVGWNDQTTE